MPILGHYQAVYILLTVPDTIEVWEEENIS
jgi:hypothetical protein